MPKLPPKKEIPRRRLSVDRLAAKLREHSGNISATARAFGVSRTAVREYMKSRPELQAVLTEARESMVDGVESRFYKDCLIDSHQYQTSRIFFLKTQAKDRGYVERQEVTGKDGEPLGPGFDPSKLNDDQLRAFRELLLLAAGPERADGDPSS